jgi:hypothetical protein
MMDFTFLRPMAIIRILTVLLALGYFQPNVARCQLTATGTPEIHMTFSGTHPPDSAVLALLSAESAIMDQHRDVAVRDSLRRQLLSPGWFYHGIDGAPIDLDGLTARQTRNGFKVLSVKVLSETLYQYENSAILILNEEMTVQDKGEVKDRTRSTLIVMAKENGRWVMQADIIGQDPKPR